MSALPQNTPVSLAEALDGQLVDALREIEALEVCLAEQRAYVEEIEAQRAALAQRIEVKVARALSGAMVRDTARALGRFTFTELRTEVGYPAVEVRKFFKPMLLGGTVTEIGRVGRAPFYEFCRPDMPGPREHPTRRPPEKDPPAGSDARATGVPVRVAAAEKITRRGRSTPGVAQKVKNRDRNYNRQQEAVAARAEANKAKAQKEPKWKRRK